MSGVFVTGTDTGVGKTRVAVALIHALRAQGLRVAAMKPVSAGSDPGELNEDVVALMQAANVTADVSDVNPYAFAEPIAPHIAAQQAGVTIELPVIAAAYSRLAAAADVVVVEGAGGWRVPLNEHEDMADLALRLGLPVVLVVGLRLGCLNHAVLTAESVFSRRVPWAGWVGNHIDPSMAQQAANLEALRMRLPGPCLGVQAFLHQETSSADAPHTTPHGLQPVVDRSPLGHTTPHALQCVVDRSTPQGGIEKNLLGHTTPSRLAGLQPEVDRSSLAGKWLTLPKELAFQNSL